MAQQKPFRQSYLDQQSFNLDQFSSIISQEDDEYQKRNYYIKKNKNKRRKIRKATKRNPFNDSLWNLQENTIYRQFLIEKGQLFDSDRIQRKVIKINVQMSEAIKSRSPDQCRSHHQKMMKHHQDIPSIIEHIQKLLNRSASVQQDKQPDCDSKTKTQISLKDLSNFELLSEDQESIWFKLIQNLSNSPPLQNPDSQLPLQL